VGFLGDYTEYYTSTLDALGISYDYFDASANLGADPTFPSLEMMREYEAVIWYTNDNYFGDIPTEADQDILIGYLQGGGRVLATGQNIARILGLTVAVPDPDTDLYEGFLGVEYLQGNVFSGTLESEQTLLGTDFAQGITLSVAISDAVWYDGAGNQGSVDEIQIPVPDEGQPDSVVKARPIFQAAQGDFQADGYVAAVRSSEPMLESPMKYFAGRTVYLGFGFEGVNNPVAGSLVVDSRATLMEMLLKFLWVEPTVTLADVNATAADVMLSASSGFVGTGAMHTDQIVSYRWNFGDGSAIQTSASSMITHTYAGGTYTAMVEVTDSFGHKSVSEATVTVQLGYNVFLPLVMRDNN
jgi:hypothetical protein